MSFAALLVLAVGVAMDAFAVSLVQGVRMRTLNYGRAFIVALSFGVFQGVMPVIGWLVGAQFERFIVNFDHWIAFGLLLLIGLKMLKDAIWPDRGANRLAEDEADEITAEKLDVRGLLLLSVATSIDALAIGVTLAFLNTSIVAASSLFLVITFALSFVGVIIGHRFGVRFRKAAEIAGGIVLIVIGTSILIEHLAF